MYQWFPEKLEQAQQLLEAQNVALGFKFNPPASQADIKRCEEELGFILPNSYKEFLRFSNGANIFFFFFSSFEINSPWWTDSGVLIQSTSVLVSFNQYQDKVYVEDDGEKKYIAFCYLGYVNTGDFCSFDITTYANSECKVLDSQHDYLFEEWHSEHVIANSFEDWLIQMFDEVIQNNGRPEYWIPSPLQG